MLTHSSRWQNKGRWAALVQKPTTSGIPVIIEPGFFILKIFGKREVHDVTKAEASDPKFINQAAVYMFLFMS